MARRAATGPPSQSSARTWSEEGIIGPGPFLERMQNITSKIREMTLPEDEIGFSADSYLRASCGQTFRAGSHPSGPSSNVAGWSWRRPWPSWNLKSQH